MTLAREAAYLHFLSKELTGINKSLAKAAKKIKKYGQKIDKAKQEEKRQKYHQKKSRLAGRLHQLLKQHDKVLEKLKHHHAEFAATLHKEKMQK